MKKHFTAHFIFAATLASMSQQTWALGFGRVVSDAVLGQSLSFSVPVHVEAGERFGDDCASAEVYYGDARLLQNMVRTTVQRGASANDWIVRITALSPIEEPVVEVSLSAGCERRFVRRFTVFADPPMVPMQGVAVADAAPSDASSNATLLAPLPRSMDADADAASARSGGGASGHRSRHASSHASGLSTAQASSHVASDAPTERPRVLRKGPTMALANELNAPLPPVAVKHDVDDGRARKAGPRLVAATPAATAPRLVLDGGYARLKLDMEEPIVGVANGASAALLASLADLDDPDTRQLRQLEQNIKAMQRVNQVNRDQAAALEAQLASARSRGDWMPYVLGLLALAVAAAAALAWKLRQQSKLAHSAWFTESQQHSRVMPKPVFPVVAPVPSMHAPVVQQDAGPSIGGELIDESVEDDVSDSAHDHPHVDVAATAPLDRAALASMMAHDSTLPRELSVEELLDLEQQADFFIALGQEDAAVDLLMSHLRSAGGQSPLPYTKLLEIYRRQGDRSAYERTRARFNRRFNAYAPDWETGPASGRSLEDYPETVAQLQATWHAPINAMAVLEGMLFKRDDTSELFDLPAYRDVLVLYSLARDLWQQAGGNAGTQVDVLLPLEDIEPGAPRALEPLAPTQPAPLDSHADAGALTTFELPSFDPIVAPVNLDLDLPDIGDSYSEPQRAGKSATEDLHATLDAFTLSPIEPKKVSSALDWDESVAPEPTKPPKKR
jgi:pilus assembly protein FimV